MLTRTAAKLGEEALASKADSAEGADGHNYQPHASWQLPLVQAVVTVPSASHDSCMGATPLPVRVMVDDVGLSSCVKRLHLDEGEGTRAVETNKDKVRAVGQVDA